jgi:transcriptional regulator with XRE-family HTH domain
MDKKEIGHKISTTRKRLGITQKELAEKLHVSDKTVSKWETGVSHS